MWNKSDFIPIETRFHSLFHSLQSSLGNNAPLYQKLIDVHGASEISKEEAILLLNDKDGPLVVVVWLNDIKYLKVENIAIYHDAHLFESCFEDDLLSYSSYNDKYSQNPFQFCEKKYFALDKKTAYWIANYDPNQKETDNIP